MKNVKRWIGVIAIIAALFPITSPAGTYLNLRLMADENVQVFKLYSPATMRTNLPDSIFELYKNQERQGYFEDIGYNDEKSYVILRFQTESHAAICDIQIRPGPPRIINITDHKDQNDLRCYYNEVEKAIMIKHTRSQEE